MNKIFLSVCVALILPTMVFAAPPLDLQKNPFAQPEFLNYRAPVKKNRVLKPIQKKPPEINLTATLLSVSEPMVMVNGQLLKLGETIEGMKLILVDEGRAIFKHRGKNHVYTIDPPQDRANTQNTTINRR